MRGALFVVSGPAGAGKGTIVNRILKERDDCVFSVSATTRAPRPGEKEGVAYFFVSEERYVEMVAGGEFLEHAGVHGHHYGTPKAFVERQLASGKNVVLDVDVQGALNVRKNAPDACLIFISPPSLAELERRLRGRATECEEEIRRRLSNARGEYAHASEYDYLVVNGDLNAAVAQVNEIIRVHGLSMVRSAEKIDRILKGETI